MTIRVAVAGASGWRGRFFVRLAETLDDVEVTGVLSRTGRPAGAIPVYQTVDELMAGAAPELVVVSVPPQASASTITALVATGTRVLAETPPAPTVRGLRHLWSSVPDADSVQVAEQYLLMPGHAARLAVTRRGDIGDVTHVQVCSTHGYHAVSLMRGYLGIVDDETPVTVSATAVTGRLADPLDRSGWTGGEEPQPAQDVISVLDFGDGRSGLYDFTDNQWHNQLRMRSIVIRGALGEIRNDDIVRLSAPRTIVREHICRSQLGYDLNLDGFDTEHLTLGADVIWRNSFLGQRLMDEEIAIATMLRAAADWAVDAGPPPYPLRRGIVDQLIALAIVDAVKRGQPVRVEPAKVLAP